MVGRRAMKMAMRYGKRRCVSGPKPTLLFREDKSGKMCGVETQKRLLDAPRNSASSKALVSIFIVLNVRQRSATNCAHDSTRVLEWATVRWVANEKGNLKTLSAGRFCVFGIFVCSQYFLILKVSTFLVFDSSPSLPCHTSS